MTTQTDHPALVCARLFSTPILPPVPPDGDFFGQWLSQAFDAEHALSSGDQVLLMIVQFMWNGGGHATLADVIHLDAAKRAVVLDALAAMPS